MWDPMEAWPWIHGVQYCSEVIHHVGNLINPWRNQKERIGFWRQIPATIRRLGSLRGLLSEVMQKHSEGGNSLHVQCSHWWQSSDKLKKLLTTSWLQHFGLSWEHWSKFSAGGNPTRGSTCALPLSSDLAAVLALPCHGVQCLPPAHPSLETIKHWTAASPQDSFPTWNAVFLLLLAFRAAAPANTIIAQSLLSFHWLLSFYIFLLALDLTQLCYRTDLKALGIPALHHSSFLLLFSSYKNHIWNKRWSLNHWTRALVKMICIPRSVITFLCDLENVPAPNLCTVRWILQPFLFLAESFFFFFLLSREEGDSQCACMANSWKEFGFTVSWTTI